MSYLCGKTFGNLAGQYFQFDVFNKWNLHDLIIHVKNKIQIHRQGQHNFVN